VDGIRIIKETHVMFYGGQIWPSAILTRYAVMLSSIWCDACNELFIFFVFSDN
jgi:hypothetical protein